MIKEDTTTVASITIEVQVNGPHTVKTIPEPEVGTPTTREILDQDRWTPTPTDEEEIFREWLIERILEEGVDIEVILTTYINTEYLYDTYAEYLSDLSIVELEAAYDELWNKSCMCGPYPDSDDMISLILDNVEYIDIHRYMYSDDQIVAEFKEYMETVTAKVLLDIFEAVALW